MTDKIFLLSTKEFEEYKDKIPYINCWWWLRSHGYRSDLALIVGYDSYIRQGGSRIDFDTVAVRPAIITPRDYKVGERILAYDFPWVVIDRGLAIAETPIGFHRFDGKSNNYEKSAIRQYLLLWLNSRS